MPGKVIEAMTCSECCKDLVSDACGACKCALALARTRSLSVPGDAPGTPCGLLRRSFPNTSPVCRLQVMLSQDTRDGMNKYCQKAVNTPWVVGEQHFKMNEFLTSMDQVRLVSIVICFRSACLTSKSTLCVCVWQVAEQLKDLGENEYAIKKQNPVHTEMIKCAYDRTTELCDEAWVCFLLPPSSAPYKCWGIFCACSCGMWMLGRRLEVANACLVPCRADCLRQRRSGCAPTGR